MIDIVIPTYKPTKILYHLVKSLELQTEKPGKIILMNTEEELFGKYLSKEQAEYITKNPKVELHHIKINEFNHGKTRNIGFSMSTAEYVICMTQDVTVIDENLIKNLVEPFSKKEVVVSYARQLPYQDCRTEEKLIRYFNYPQEPRIKRKEDIKQLGIKTYFASNVCAAYVKEQYDALDGFLPNVIFNEDMLYAAKVIDAGYAVSYTAKAVVVHSHNYSNLAQFHRNFDVAVSQVNHPEIFAKIQSESEGKRMIKEITKQLVNKGKWYLVPRLYCASAYKYAGYFLGKRYMRLSKRFVVKCSMNKNYW